MPVGVNPQVRLSRLGLTGDVTVEYYEGGQLRTHHSRTAAVDIGLGGMFISWSRSPAEQVLKAGKLTIRWTDPPFSNGAFEASAELACRVEEGIHVRFVHVASAQAQQLYQWIRSLEERLAGSREDESAIKTSKWYTLAAVTSALGLCLGAVGMFFQLMRWFTAYYVPQILLLLMVLSIAAFAYMRAVAGRHEIRAIKRGS